LPGERQVASDGRGLDLQCAPFGVSLLFCPAHVPVCLRPLDHVDPAPQACVSG